MPYLLTQDQYDELESSLDHDGLRPDYSGRGMYGKTCIGFDYKDSADETQFKIQLAKILGPEILHYDEGEALDIDDLDDVLEELGGGAHDSMGLGSIVYYPSIQVEGHARLSRF